MATNYYSNHFSSAASATSKEVGHSVGPSGGPGVNDEAVIGHGRRRVDVSSITIPAGILDTDVLYMTTLKATDRITEIRVAAPVNNATSLEFDLGIYTNNANNDGAVKDADLFSGTNGYDVGAAAIAYVSGFARTGATATNILRGAPLYVLAGDSNGDVGAYDICFTCDDTISGTPDATQLSLYVEYVSGD